MNDGGGEWFDTVFMTVCLAPMVLLVLYMTWRVVFG